MYIETWQMLMVGMVIISAYFSYGQGRKEGVAAGVNVVISDLHEKGIISVYRDIERGEVVIGRYDEFDWEAEVEIDTED